MPLGSMYSKFKFWILLAAIVIAGALVLVVWLSTKPKTTTRRQLFQLSAESTVPSIKLLSGDAAKKYFSQSSTDGKIGRDLLGNYYSDSSGAIQEHGLGANGATDLAQYLLTHPVGHNQNPMSEKLSWYDYVDMYANPVEAFTGPFTKGMENTVLEISGGPNKGQTYCPVFLDKSCQFKGIVVRHGATLLIHDVQDLEIKTEFILVESGGLLQAGWKDSARFQHKLQITLTNPVSGYKFMGVVASQYSHKVYFPGFVEGITDHTGKPNAFSNTFGAKSIAVGFNGSLHLAGEISTPSPYMGTWAAHLINANGTESNWVDNTRLLTWFDPETEVDLAESVGIRTKYPNTWCRVQEGQYKAGASTISIDPRDANPANTVNALGQWKPGAQIVITCKTKQYNSFKTTGVQGMNPLWLDFPTGSANAEANETANQALIASIRAADANLSTDTGVEVATIKSITPDGVITLQRPLKFAHDSSRVRLTNAKGQVIRVDTNLHVGLLTRNILITSERNSTAEKYSGCNVLVGTSTPTTGDMAGPGGSVQCNYQGSGYNPGQMNITKSCYTDRDNKVADSRNYCGSETPGLATGHWLLGTAGQQGCNAIQGGHCMFRLGSSVELDAVELKYMGQPANFGTIARYALHFHISGFTKSFTEYLRSRDYPRSATVENCSIWCSPTRWVTLHGTSEATIRNNVGFVCYGSGFFVEDGTELHNVFEHNAAISVLTTSKHDYWNPVPIYGNTASDLAMASAFWYKNNQTVSIRNLACNSPASVIHTWIVPQDITPLKGPSSVCFGDKALKLPALAGARSLATFGIKAQQCWTPDNFRTEKFISDDQRCITLTSSNCSNPYRANSENIAYCMMGGLSEFPEALGMAPGDYHGCGALGAASGHTIGATVQNPQPQWLPTNSENSCSDRIGQCVYPTTIWGGGESSYPYQPISPTDLNNINEQPHKVVTTDGLATANTVPKIIAHWLTFNLSASSGLFGGAGWTKGSPTFLVGCASLQDGGGTGQSNPGSITGKTPNCSSAAEYEARYSAMWVVTVGNSHDIYPNGYHVFYDIISNGSVAVPSSPTWFGGERSFYDNRVTVHDVEYTMPVDDPNNASVTNSGQAMNMFFTDMDPLTAFPTNFWKPRCNSTGRCNKFGLYDLTAGTFVVVNGVNDVGAVTPFQLEGTRKFPYLCKDQKLFMPTEDIKKKHPELLGVVMNAQNNSFLSTYARGTFGDKLCFNLSNIVSCKKGEGVAENTSRNPDAATNFLMCYGAKDTRNTDIKGK